MAGHGTYIREGPGRAEVAFAVADAWHGHGIATVLLAHLAAAAAEEGIETFTATVLSENRRMLGVFHDSGFPVVARRAEGEIEIELPTSLSPAARQRFEERQRTADVAAVAHVLRPSSVAVIGGRRGQGLRGALHRVEDPAALAVRRGRRRARGDRRRRPTRSSTPRAACAAKGVRALVVLTAGSSRTSDELLAVCRSAGMRLVGPDSPRRREPGDRVRRDRRSRRAAAGRHRLRVAERRVRDRGDRRGGGARPRLLVVRLDGRQGRPLGQRLHGVLGAGRRHVGAAALPGVVRQPAPVRPDRAPDHAGEADRGGQGRPHGAARRPRTPARCSRRRT